MKRAFIYFLVGFICNINLFSQDTLVGWTFPDQGADSLADIGTVDNLSMGIFTSGGTSTLNFKNGYTGKAAQVTGWDGGTDTKAWVIQVNTYDYADIYMFSRQSSGGNDPGPRDFKLQYSIDGMISWSDVPNGMIKVHNDWTTGVVDSMVLPPACDNQNSLFIRWLMNTDSASDGSIVAASGKSKIDDIFIVAATQIINNVEDTDVLLTHVYPNPCIEELILDNLIGVCHLELFNVIGQLVKEDKTNETKHKMDMSKFDPGLYYLRISSVQTEVVKSFTILKN